MKKILVLPILLLSIDVAFAQISIPDGIPTKIPENISTKVPDNVKESLAEFKPQDAELVLKKASLSAKEGVILFMKDKNNYYEFNQKKFEKVIGKLSTFKKDVKIKAHLTAKKTGLVGIGDASKNLAEDKRATYQAEVVKILKK